jgi:membrane fusion protein, hemolysin D
MSTGKTTEPAAKPATPRRNPGGRYRRFLSSTRAVKPKAPVVAEFQPDAVEIEERTPPRFARLTLYCVVALIIAAVTWASFSRVDTIVVAQGKLTTTTSSLVVQPLETSVIRSIHAKVGDVVSRGQVLAVLDPTFSQADVDKLRVSVSALNAAVNRITAELNDHDYFPANSANTDENLQRQLFLQRKAFYDASIRNYNAQIASAKAVLKSSENEEALLSQRLETVQSIESMRTLLMNKDLGSKLNVLLSRDARLDVENNLARIRGNRVDYTHRLEKARADKEVFIEDFRRTAEQELVDTLAKRNSAAEDLKKAELRRQLIELKAPADGVVLEVADRTVGSVVREAETLFVLVPRDVPLQAEVKVEGKDVGRVAVGQPVRLKFEAFPFQKYGTGKGVVRVVSQDSFATNPKGEAERQSGPYYRVLVDVTDMHLKAPANLVRMIPGMAVTAEMRTGDRRVISYFLYPLLRGLDESIREP